MRPCSTLNILSCCRNSDVNTRRYKIFRTRNAYLNVLQHNLDNVHLPLDVSQLPRVLIDVADLALGLADSFDLCQ